MKNSKLPSRFCPLLLALSILSITLDILIFNWDPRRGVSDFTPDESSNIGL